MSEPTKLILSDGTEYEGRLQYEDGEPVVRTATCGACGFVWNDALITSLTPTPSGRCPNEYNHREIKPDTFADLTRLTETIGYHLENFDFSVHDDEGNRAYVEIAQRALAELEAAVADLVP